MKKILILVLTGSLLSGCQFFEKTKSFVDTAVQTVTNPDTVENVMLSYNSVQNVALAYGRSCQAKVIPKSCWNVIAQLKPYEDKATRAVLALDDYSKTYPASDPILYIQAAKNAIKAYKDTQFINGVK